MSVCLIIDECAFPYPVMWPHKQNINSDKDWGLGCVELHLIEKQKLHTVINSAKGMPVFNSKDLYHEYWFYRFLTAASLTVEYKLHLQ